jgi:hypothetical protein
VRKRCWGHPGVWRQKGKKAQRVNQGDPAKKDSAFMEGFSRRTEVAGRQSAHSSEEAP